MNFLDDRVLPWLWERAIPIPFAGCWLWIGGEISGYGIVRPSITNGIVVARKSTKAHRLFYEALHGSIPDDTEIDHLCRVTLCVNPAHLEAVPHQVNVKRGQSGKDGRLGLLESSKTHCIHGHPLTPDNITVRRNPDGSFLQRECRQCCRDRWHARKLRDAAGIPRMKVGRPKASESIATAPTSARRGSR